MMMQKIHLFQTCLHKNIFHDNGLVMHIRMNISTYEKMGSTVILSKSELSMRSFNENESGYTFFPWWELHHLLVGYNHQQYSSYWVDGF